ncbi:MAG: hypothetical protein Q8N88_04590 [Nanoarchaeota archaeon]|nr:hypothetical protein [Nanoarchaeota archaeon]
MKKGTKKNKQSKVKEILHTLLDGGFFDSTGKTTFDTIKKLAQKGFTIKGRKIGMIARMLTQMCQDQSTKLERDELPKEKRTKNEIWMFKRVK